MIVTGSQDSFLCSLEPGFSTSRMMWVMPALYPMKAVRWGCCEASSRGNALHLPRPRRHRFLGRKPSDP